MDIYCELGKMIRLLNPYTQEMEFGHHNHASQQAAQGESPEEAGEIGSSIASSMANIQVEIDNYQGEWTFRGGIEQIRRGLRVTYHYKIMKKDDNGVLNWTGVYATEHLLIGYAGGNGN